MPVDIAKYEFNEPLVLANCPYNSVVVYWYLFGDAGFVYADEHERDIVYAEGGLVFVGLDFGVGL